MVPGLDRDGLAMPIGPTKACIWLSPTLRTAPLKQFSILTRRTTLSIESQANGLKKRTQASRESGVWLKKLWKTFREDVPWASRHAAKEFMDGKEKLDPLSCAREFEWVPSIQAVNGLR